MTNRATLAALIERVEAGETTVVLDYAVWKVLNPEFEPSRGWGGPPCYTLSIDEQDRMPGRIVQVQWHFDYSSDPSRGRYSAIAMHNGLNVQTFAPTEPAARLAAKLRAMMEGMPLPAPPDDTP